MTAFKAQRAEALHVQVKRHLRDQIRSGVLPTGKKLPPTLKLARQLGVHHKAVQRAMTQLAAEGLVDRTRRRGTFVRPATERAVIGLLFGPDLSHETAHFYRAVRRALQGEVEAREWTCRAYDGLLDAQGMPRPQDSPWWRLFRKDSQDGLFKGLVEFATGSRPWSWPEGCENLPRVCCDQFHTDSDIRLDAQDFFRASLRCLAEQGRQNIVYLRTPWYDDDAARQAAEFDRLFDAVHEVGLTQPKVETALRTAQGAPFEKNVYQWAREWTRQWKATSDRKGRADGLLVGDDIAMRAVTLALVEAGIRVPADLLVVSQASEGVELHYGIPVVRYEYPTRQLVSGLLDLLWKRMVGEAEPKLPIVLRGQIRNVEA